MTKILEYKAEDIFQDIEGDDKNVLMTIPPEIQEQMGWVEGDILVVNIDGEGVISITKKEENGEG